MKRSILVLLSVISGSVFTVLLPSCKKQHIDSETQSSSDYSLCEGEFTKLGITIMEHSQLPRGVKGENSSYHPTIIFPDTVLHPGWPRTLVINYDSVVLDSADLKIRKGKLICEFSNYWTKRGARIKITLENYLVNDGKFTVDSIVLINTHEGSIGMNVYGGRYVFKDWTVGWTCKRSVTQLAGIKTPWFTDDVFCFTGNSAGSTRSGKKITASVALPLIKHTSCKWIDIGKIDLTMEGVGTQTIDFGNGTCDNTAVLGLNGSSFNFTLD